jgi:alpha-tubulin suppressor-like RCC1 family protein
MGLIFFFVLNKHSYGQLGDSTMSARLVPTAVTDISKYYTQISSGAFHTCVITNQTSKVYCWGYNSFVLFFKIFFFLI